MHRTSLLLPIALKKKAERVAERRGMSLGALIREQLSLVVDKESRGRRANDPLFADFSSYDGAAPKNLAANHDDYLYGDE